jgi:hypothetical protein
MSSWRRFFALVLDVVLLAPPFALLCVAGSFATEASHRGWDPLYVIAGALAGAIPFCEVAFAGSPGLLILRGRIRRADGASSPLHTRLLRTIFKYLPLAYLPAVAGLTLVIPTKMNLLIVIAAVALLALLAWFVLRPMVLLRLGRATESLWFDHYAGTSVWRLIRRGAPG